MIQPPSNKAGLMARPLWLARTRGTRAGILREVAAAAIAVSFLVPFYFVLINTFKPIDQILTSFVSAPRSLYLDNYVRAWRVSRIERTFFNSLVVTSLAVAGNLFLASMASYMLARRSSRVSWLIYILFTVSLIVPFHAIMLPLVRIASSLRLINRMFGLILIYWGLLSPFAVFFVHGFVRSLPVELEDAARIDGCTTFQTYFIIVLPLLRPALSTIAALNFLRVWNDFLLPLLIIFNNKAIATIPLMQYNLYGQYNVQWDIALAAVVLGIIPCIVFFLIMQKYVVKGLTVGAVKG